jgi:hypothetical protein
MGDTSSNHNNGIETLGLQVVVASPVDDRLMVDTVSVLEELFSAPETEEKINYRVVLYDGILILTKDTKQIYIWAESVEGLMDTPYVYPEYMTNEQGQDYANKSYNFVLHTPESKITKTHTIFVDTFILLENKVLPYSVLFNKEGAQVMMKSNEDGYQSQQLPDHIEIVAEGIKVFFDPKPADNEIFRITVF